MKELTKTELKRGFSAAGLGRGQLVMVHSSLSSLGRVKGGADTVIDALTEVLGPEGTLAMSSSPSRNKVFDFRESPTVLGRIPDVFWRRENVKRSLHPTHSFAARGKHADYLVQGHEKARTPYCDGTPYMRLVELGGFVLMLGVDLDRLTLLHSVEGMADAPYLRTIEMEYMDSSGEKRKAVAERMAGPHRNFKKLDKSFRESGIMTTGRIGGAVWRLIDARRMFSYCMKRMESEPDMMLCDNPSCGDCRRQRGMVREKTLRNEDFVLSAAVSGFSRGIEDIIGILQAEGIRRIELDGNLGEEFLSAGNSEPAGFAAMLKEKGVKISAVHLGRHRGGMGPSREQFERIRSLGCGTAVLQPFAGGGKGQNMNDESLAAARRAADSAGLSLLLENAPGGAEAVEMVVRAVAKQRGGHGIALNPANICFSGGKPFTGYAGQLKHVQALYLNDCIPGEPGEYKKPGRGAAEISELVSALRARSFAGAITFKYPGSTGENFPCYAEAFRVMLAGI